jgi:hypothetical protein
MDSRTLTFTVSFNAPPSPHAASARGNNATVIIRFMAFPLSRSPRTGNVGSVAGFSSPPYLKRAPI